MRGLLLTTGSTVVLASLVGVLAVGGYWCAVTSALGYVMVAGGVLLGEGVRG